ncbi:MAG: hypothetical protein ACLQMO_05415 [Acidobacteriaceae bacterium]
MTQSKLRGENPESRTDSYRGYSNLPPLVGLHSMTEASTKGLTVAESVSRLLRLHWSLKRLHSIFVSRIAAIPIYELKMAFSLHAHYCAEHVEDFARRVREMRQPPYGLESSPEDSLDIFFDEILAAPDIPSLVLGLYAHAIPAVVRGLERLIADTNKVFDHPTYRVCRLTLLELKDVFQYGEQAVESLVEEKTKDSFREWSELLEKLLRTAGDLDGTQPRAKDIIHPIYSVSPYRYDGVPKRDERFKDSYNMGVNAEAFLFNTKIPPLPKSIMLYFKRMREIDVPEVMSSILAETKDKPWEYYRAMTRQLWDEARHAMMGEIGFVSMGIDWTLIPLNFTWSLGLNTQLVALERHAVLYTIEQGLMPKKTGKQYEWEVALATGNLLTSLIQDYDWADEILHARIGREWLVPEVGSQKQALAYGDLAWSKILVDWEKWRHDGLTQHRNWWPEIYLNACKYWGVEPDPELLAYNTTYENVRADLKQVSG